MAKKTNNSGLADLSNTAKQTLSLFSTAKKNKGSYNYSSEDVSALKDIAAIPGAIDTLKGNPDMLQQVLEDPVGALDTYNEAAAGSGGTSEPAATITVDTPITPPPSHTASEMGLPGVDTNKDNASFDTAMSSLDQTIKQLDEVNQAYLKGEVPGDVTASVRQGTAESALTAGLFGTGAVQLQTQQLGLTSLDMINKGIEQGAAIAGLKQGAADLYRARREFDYTYSLNTQQFLEDMRRTDVTVQQTELQRTMFNAEQNLKLIGYIADLVTNRGQLQFNYAVNDMSSDSVATDFNQLIGQLDALLVKANT